MYQLDLEKVEEPETKLPTFSGSYEKQGNSTDTSISASLITLKSLTVWITEQTVKNSEIGTPDPLTCLLKNLYAGQEATIRIRHGTMDCSKLGKEYIKPVQCDPGYLTYKQSTLCKMPG